MSLDQTTVAGVAAFTTAGVLFFLHVTRVKAERRQQRQRAVAAVRAGELPAVAAPPSMSLAAREVIHICAKVIKGERTDAKRELGEGLLVASNRRVCFFGARKVSLTWKKIGGAARSPDGDVMVRAQDGRAFTFTLAKGEDAELIGEILAVLDGVRARNAAKAALAAKAREAVVADPDPPEKTEP
jgi:hypothetical protein